MLWPRNLPAVLQASVQLFFEIALTVCELHILILIGKYQTSIIEDIVCALIALRALYVCTWRGSDLIVPSLMHAGVNPRAGQFKVPAWV